MRSYVIGGAAYPRKYEKKLHDDNQKIEVNIDYMFTYILYHSKIQNMYITFNEFIEFVNS